MRNLCLIFNKSLFGGEECLLFDNYLYGYNLIQKSIMFFDSINNFD